MREYISDIIHEGPNLVIGTNGRSVIFGQKNNWIVVDKTDIPNIATHIGFANKLKSAESFKTDDFAVDVIPNSGIIMKQRDDCISINSSLFLEKLG